MVIMASTKIKLISRLEWDLINSKQLNFIDTFVKDEFRIGDDVYLRCHYWDEFVDGYKQILITVVSINVVSYNTLFNKRLYRVVFSTF